VEHVSREVAMAQRPASHTRALGTEPTVERDAVLDLLFRSHYAALLRLARVLIGSREEAEEIVQDAFVSLHRNWSRLQNSGSASAYLRAAVVGGCRNRRRRFARAAAFAPKLAQFLSDPSVQDPAVDLENADSVASAVRSLPTRQREVIVARYYLGLTESQTAELLDIGVGSVKRHAHRALAALERRIEATP
jgi:RNA polymerase sigma factor (sigma-70 family)